jgi:predicted lipoprotein with Yx(FWY)xxD motif
VADRTAAEAQELEMFPIPRGRVSGRPRLGWAAAGLAALALIAAACTAGGSASSGAGAYGAGPAPSATPPAAAVVDLRGSRLGQILVDGQGRSLYLFEADRMGRSSCNAACASAWPPYLSNGAPKAGDGVAGGQLSTTVRADDGGGTQVTYHGHPLYYYVGDSEPGDTAGQGLNQFGARWYVVAASGDEIVSD